MVASGWWWRGRRGNRSADERATDVAPSRLVPRGCCLVPDEPRLGSRVPMLAADVAAPMVEGRRREARGARVQRRLRVGGWHTDRSQVYVAKPPPLMTVRSAARCAALALPLLLPLTARAQGIAGHVVDTLGCPLLAAVVTAQPGDGITRTDADGRFVLPALGPGQVSASDPAHWLSRAARGGHGAGGPAYAAYDHAVCGHDAGERAATFFADVPPVERARCGGAGVLRSVEQDPTRLPADLRRRELRPHRVLAADGPAITRAVYRSP